MIIVVVHSILKSISDNLENKGTSKIAYYAQYILIVTLVMANFSDMVTMIKTAITNIIGYMNTLIPILLALIMTTGNVVTANLLQPVILFSVVFIGNTITLIILPITFVATVLGILSNLSDKVQIGKLSKFLKSGITWTLGFVITIFVSILSLEGGLTSSVDGITIKGLKSASSTFIPVVGKALGDSVDTVLGATSIIKNAVGVVGIIMVVGICAIPIIKLIVITVIYHFTAAITEPLADKKIVDVIEQMAGTFKVLLGIMFFVAVLFIIGLAMTLKISNAGMMYR